MNKQKAANITNLTLGSIMPVDEVVKAYFTNDKDAIIKGIATNVKDADTMFKALAQANYEIENETLLSQTSNYGNIQASIVEQIVTPTNASFLETNVINSEEVLGDTCPNLGSAEELLTNIKQENLGIEMTR